MMRAGKALLITLLLMISSLVQAASCEDGLSLALSYEKPLGELARFLEVEVVGEGIRKKFIGEDVIHLGGVTKGVYYIIARWKGVEVGKWVIGVSEENLALNLKLALTDLSLEVKDLEDRPLKDILVEISPRIYGEMKVSDGIILLKAMPSTLTYLLKTSWRSPLYGTMASSSVSITPLEAKLMRSIILPVGDLRVRVVDLGGEPIGGAIIRLAGVEARTDSMGEAIFQQIPLESEDHRSIRYNIEVIRNESLLYSGVIEVSRARTSLTIVIELYDLRVKVEGVLGQPLPYAKVVLRREGVEVGAYAADSGGYLEVRGLPPAIYSIEVDWRGYVGKATISMEDLKAGRIAVIRLPIYAELLGVPLTLQSLIMVILAGILMVIAVAIILIEYILWRGRKLGIYPPKKK